MVDEGPPVAIQIFAEEEVVLLYTEGVSCGLAVEGRCRRVLCLVYEGVLEETENLQIAVGLPPRLGHSRRQESRQKQGHYEAIASIAHIAQSRTRGGHPQPESLESRMILIDAHLDLSMNALNWDRDLELDVHELRKREAGMAEKGRARGTTTLPEMRKGEVALSLATVICRVDWPGSPASGVANQAIAYSKAQGQLAYYRIMESKGKMRQVRTQSDLATHMQAWQESPDTTPLGYILSMEGADPIVDAEQVASWWADGLRVVSLSHYGFSAYAYGTDTEGGLTERGAPLLQGMADAGMIVDLTHLADDAFFETLEAFSGPVLASHNNCRTLVPGCRQFTDEQVKAIIARGGVIGAALDAWMIYPGWIKGETQPEAVSLDNLVDHIMHICELAGNTNHVGVGSDLDGGYGNEQTPHDCGTIADLQKLAPLLSARGFSDDDVQRFMRGNWIRFFSEHLPA